MKKTYVTTVPNHIGAFLSASRLLAALDVNITRVSYNKAVDSHTIFIEAEGSRQQLAQADEQLAAIGYLRSGGAEKSVVLLEFQLRDVPGGVTDILACIERFGFNISYLSSQENGTDYQLFKMGLFVEDPARIHAFLREARALCPVRVIDYDRAEKTFDNSIFYDSFVSGQTSPARPCSSTRILPCRRWTSAGSRPTARSIPSAALRSCCRKPAARASFRA